MATPGVDCHIVIDGVGYIFADTGDLDSESRVSVAKEGLAPFFGDPVNVLDPLSSDLTMLLPIGQSDFSDGIGNTDLEASPNGYERGENLIVTPQKTLINGPAITSTTFATTAPTAPSGLFAPDRGFFVSGINNSVRRNYIFFSTPGRERYYFNGTVWADLAAASDDISDLAMYDGRAIACYSAVSADVIDGSTITAATFYFSKFFSLNGRPYGIVRNGRIYAAYLSRPPALNGAVEAGAVVAERHWQYQIAYVLPGSPNLVTELSLPLVITKTANGQVRLTLPVRSYRGGPVKRWLYRSVTNDPSIMYRIADDTVLGSLVTNYVDAVDDAAITGFSQATWDKNNTAIVLLTRGTNALNEYYSDTDKIMFAESAVLDNTEFVVTSVSKFTNSAGVSALLIGTSMGLYLWDGVSREPQKVTTLAPSFQNFDSMAVNHGVVYYTTGGRHVNIWSPESESILLGPWVTHYPSNLGNIRLINSGPHVLICVNGRSKYNGSNAAYTIYAYDGKSFTWSTSVYHNATTPTFNPAIGEIVSGLANSAEAAFAWYDGYPASAPTNKQYKSVSLQFPITSFQTAGVVFSTSVSDLNLPRLRKQVHGVMVRYAQLSPIGIKELNGATIVGATTITLTSVVGLAVGDWICISDTNPKFAEYRKISNIVGFVLTLSHTLGAPLLYAHASGVQVGKCQAVVTLRNVFTSVLATQDIEIGGPAFDADIFALMMLPQPVYSYADALTVTYNSGTVMELQGWSMLTALNPEYNGLMDVNIRLMDNVKLPNNTNDTGTAAERRQNLITAYTKGTVTVVDALNTTRVMRFQRLSFSYEEPSERHSAAHKQQATAHVRLIDQSAELMKQETLTLTGLSR